VMVEAFDCWKQGKTAGDYSRLFDDWHAKDLQAMVRRERNHPSVIIWSIGNEIAEQDGPELAQHLRDIVHAEDPTRPVTAGCNNPSAGTNGFQTAVDVFGLNYSTGNYRRILDHPGNEQKPVYTSESSSCISSRGEYFFPIKRGRSSEANFQVSSYDVDAPPWAQPPDEVFEALDHNPAFFGEFVWTGFDYLGEPTRSDIRADGPDLAFVTVVVSDQEGVPVPRSHNLVQFEIEGPGEIVAVGNGDATSHEPFQAKERSAYNGLCRVIIKGRSGQPGPITLKAKSNGLKDAAISLSSQ